MHHLGHYKVQKDGTSSSFIHYHHVRSQTNLFRHLLTYLALMVLFFQKNKLNQPSDAGVLRSFHTLILHHSTQLTQASNSPSLSATDKRVKLIFKLPNPRPTTLASSFWPCFSAQATVQSIVFFFLCTCTYPWAKSLFLGILAVHSFLRYIRRVKTNRLPT